jgi:hypothetical protein
MNLQRLPVCFALHANLLLLFLNNVSLVINNIKNLSCMYFTTSSLFHSLACGFHMAESIYQITWYKMVQEFRHVTMKAHLKKKAVSDFSNC